MNTWDNIFSSRRGGSFFAQAVKLFICLLLTFVILPEAVGYAGTGKIKTVRLERKNGIILVNAVLKNGISKQVEDEIYSGMEKELFYYIVLKRKQRYWMDEEVGEVTVKYSIKYDLLKKQFHVEMEKNGKREGSFILQSFDKTKEIISRVNDIQITRTASLKKKYRYFVSVKSVMKKKQLPYYIDYIFFFIPILELDTPWKNSSRIRY